MRGDGTEGRVLGRLNDWIEEILSYYILTGYTTHLD